MTYRTGWRRFIPVILITAFLAIPMVALLGAANSANAAPARPHTSQVISGTDTDGPHPSIVAPSPTAVIKTCVPRAIIYDGIYRIDNDLFAGSAGKSCITAQGNKMTLDTSYVDQGGKLIAYPKVYIGQNYTSGDPESGLPVKMTKAQAYTLHVRFGGRSPCTISNYIEDLDLWFSTSLATADQHGNAELVVAYAWCHDFDHATRRMSIGHHWYLVSTWLTPPGDPRADQWPIFLIQTDGQAHSRSIRVATFLWHLKELGWLKQSEWLDSGAAGVEVWHGAKGLTVEMTP